MENKQTSKTLSMTIQGIGDTLIELVEKAENGTATKADLKNMKILTDCIEHLRFYNKELFN